MVMASSSRPSTSCVPKGVDARDMRGHDDTQSIDPPAREPASRHAEKISDRLATVGADNASGCVTGFVGCEENGRTGDVLAGSNPSHRHALAPAFVDFRIGV